jgi:hypothetical protein
VDESMKRKLNPTPKAIGDLEIKLAVNDSLAIEAMLLRRQV